MPNSCLDCCDVAVAHIHRPRRVVCRGRLSLAWEKLSAVRRV